jgi:deoxyribodipyrimidine photo-lyase
MPELFESDPFEPSIGAALARLAAVRPGDYARSRNHIDGAVTRLSPYITHGYFSLPQVLQAVQARYRLNAQDKFVYELGWREFFHHVWQYEGGRIFDSLHEGVLPDDAYAPELPQDIRQGATGVPAIDIAVRELYATGYLHNHARMWLASYVVHLRKVHWRAGADWLYGHLLDGDLASNHLSWQWVAGTGSSKPYLFNADNVARYAPAAWHCAGSVVDASYEALEAIARSRQAVPVRGGEAVAEPALFTAPPSGLQWNGHTAAARTPALPAVLPSALPDATWLVHPWALREPPPGREAMGVFVAGFHAAWPWSARRWQFVATRMAALCRQCVWLQGPLPQVAQGHADLHLQGHAEWRDATPVPSLFADPGARCASFSQFWQRSRLGVGRPEG